MHTEDRIPPRDNSLLLQYIKIITKKCNAHNVRMSVGRIGGARCPVNKMTEISLLKMRLIRYYDRTSCVFVEMKFFAVIFLVTLLMMAAMVIQEVSAKYCGE